MTFRLSIVVADVSMFLTVLNVFLFRLKETARLSVTNYASNQTSTYESASNLILPYKATNFTTDSPMYIGSLPDGAMVSYLVTFLVKFCLLKENQQPHLLQFSQLYSDS